MAKAKQIVINRSIANMRHVIDEPSVSANQWSIEDANKRAIHQHEQKYQRLQSAHREQR